MATAAPNQPLPLLYSALEPLNTTQHAGMKVRRLERLPTIPHAIPATVDEFALLQRHYPIVFSVGENPVPLALMGLNEGVNVFVDDEGMVTGPTYMPAYVRRYPFMLAKLRADSEDLSLCFDPTSDLLGEFEDGVALFDGTDPSEACKASLQFCEQFEIAAKKTANFVAELKKHGLLMDGELNLQIAGLEQPFNYRGFSMVDEGKLREVRGDVLRGWNQNGMLPLIYAHLFSLELVRDIFGRQLQQGKGPIAPPQELN